MSSRVHIMYGNNLLTSTIIEKLTRARTEMTCDPPSPPPPLLRSPCMMMKKTELEWATPRRNSSAVHQVVKRRQILYLVSCMTFIWCGEDLSENDNSYLSMEFIFLWITRPRTASNVLLTPKCQSTRLISYSHGLLGVVRKKKISATCSAMFQLFVFFCSSFCCCCCWTLHPDQKLVYLWNLNRKRTSSGFLPLVALRNKQNNS